MKEKYIIYSSDIQSEYDTDVNGQQREERSPRQPNDVYDIDK